MKKKGFTLIELLAVIIILGILAFILIPIIQDLIENARYASAVNSAINYVKEANTQAAIEAGGFEEFSLNISDDGILESGNNDSELNKIKYKGKGPTYTYLHFSEDGKHVKYARFCIWGYSIDYRIDQGASKSSNDYCGNEVAVQTHYDTGEAIYYNVDTGKQCSEQAYLNNVYEWSKHANYISIGDQLYPRGMGDVPDGLHTGCIKFYVLKDEKDTITLLTAFNINEFGPDKNEEDTTKYGLRNTYWADIKDGAEKQNVKDFNNITNPQPNTHYVMDLLKNYTNNWTTIPIENDYEYSYTYNNGTDDVTDNYTITYKTNGYNARLITKNEVDEVISDGKSSILIDHTNQHPYTYILDNGNRYQYLGGYYTSDALNSNEIYVFSSDYGTTIGVDGTTSSNKYGVRPVIKIYRDDLWNKEPVPEPSDIPDTPIDCVGNCGGGNGGNDSLFEPGTILYFNVTTGTQCTKGEADNNLSYRHTPVGVNSGCMKFYVLPNLVEKDTVSLMLDHPFSYNAVYWFKEASDIYGQYGTVFPPMTILSDIALNTSTWQGVEIPSNYTMESLQGNYSQWYFKTVIPYKDLGLKARLITAEEIDAVIQRYPEYERSAYDSYNTTKEIAVNMGHNSLPYAYHNCYYEQSSNSDKYNPNCNPYGTVGYAVGTLSWLINDYRNYDSYATNSPAARYMDMFDTDAYSNYSYKGCFWTSSYAKSYTGQIGPKITIMCDGARWEDTPDPRLYKAVIEVKKNKLTSVTKDDDIEITLGGTANYNASGTYSVLDPTIASIDASGKITGLKIGVTQVKAVDGGSTHYAKLVVNKPANTYYSNAIQIYYNPTTGLECTTSEYSCTSTSNCLSSKIIGETPAGNYIVYINKYSAINSTNKNQWSPRFAIDDDATAETKYGVMAYNHWYKTLEYVADLSKNWVVDEYPKDYIDYTTKEYVIPWGTPAYYENGNPVYSKARAITVEDVVKVNAATQKDSVIAGNVYEFLNNTGNATTIHYVYNAVFEDYDSAVGYLGPTSDSPSINYAIALSKSRISNLSGMATYNSTATVIQLSNVDYTWTQSSTDGGSVDIQETPRTCSYSWCKNNYVAYPKTNGHVHLVGTNDSGYTLEKDIYIDIQYSCGQVDSCGNTTPACN